MKKVIFLFVIMSCFAGSAAAQNYKKIFYKAQTLENADVKVTISDAVATQTGIKFKIRVVNKSADYIFYKPSESAFKIKGKENRPQERGLIIRPGDDDYRVVDLKGPQHMVAASYQFILNGLYKVIMNSKETPAADFKLPPSQNDFKVGGFSVNLEKFKKETAKTDTKFELTYTGDKIGVFEPIKVAMKMPDGREFANYNSDKKPFFFEKGDINDFTLAWKDIPISSGDMQKADMLITWRDAFKEVQPEKLMPVILTIQFDEELTNEKGK